MSIFVTLDDFLSSDGAAKIELGNLTSENATGDVEFLLNGEYVGNVTKITLEDFVKAGDGVEVVIDLSTFSSDFDLKLLDEGSEDKITLQGVDQITIDNNGSRDVTFVDANGEDEH